MLQDSTEINTYCSFTPGGNYNTIKGFSILDIDNKIFRETAYDVTFNPIIDPREWVFYGHGEATNNNREGRSSRYDTKLDLEKKIGTLTTLEVTVNDENVELNKRKTTTFLIKD